MTDQTQQNQLQPNEITSCNLKWDRYANQYRGGIWWAAKDFPHHPREALATGVLEDGMWVVRVNYNGRMLTAKSAGNPMVAMGAIINAILGHKKAEQTTQTNLTPPPEEIHIDMSGGIAS